MAVAAPALAQSYSSPPRQVIDARGVDVATGEIVTSLPQISVGSEVFALRQSGLFAHNPLISYIRFSGTTRLVVIDGVTKKFDSNGSGGWVPADADGSTLVKNGGGDDFTYTTARGVVFVFYNQTGASGNGVPWNAIRSHLASITRPDGRKSTYTYRVELEEICGRDPCTYRPHVRVQSIKTSEGYMLKAGYAGNDPASDFDTLTSVRAIDLSVDYCSPSADTCSYTQSWPIVTISGNNVTDQAGATTVVTENASGAVTGIDLPAASGNDLTVTYNGSNQVTTVTEDGIGHTYGYTTGSGTATTTVTQPNGGTETYVINTTTTRPTSITNETGQTRTFLYDSSGRLTRQTEPEGNYAQTTYDARGNVTELRQVAKAGSGLADIVTTANFAASCSNIVTCNLPNYAIDARGNQTDYTYDAVHGGITRVQLPAAGSGQPRAEINYAYTQLTGQIKDAGGTLVSSGLPEYKATQITACATAATCSGSANETRITFAYATPNLLPSSKTVASGNGAISVTESYEYDAFDNLIAVDGPLSGTDDKVFYFFETIRSRRKGSIGADPDGAGSLPRQAVRFTYDAEDRLLTTEYGTTSGTALADLNAMTVTSQVNNTLDANGRVAKVALAASGTTHQVVQYSYDNMGNVECTALRMNPAIFASLPSSACTAGTAGTLGTDRITQYVRDSASRLIEQRGALGTAEQTSEFLAYTANGKIAYVKDGQLNRTTSEYDGHDRPVKTRYPVATAGADSSSTSDYEQLTYDAASNITQQRLRDANTITLAYDNLNRATSVSGATIAGQTLSYDLLGRSLAATFTSGGQSVANAYDGLGRIVSQTTPQGAISYLYDAASRRSRTSWADGFYVSYDYDTLGRVTAIRENGAASGVGVLAAYTYDSLGRRSAVAYGNGTSRTYAYDPLSRLEGLKTDLASTASDQLTGRVAGVGTALAYNPASQLAAITRSNDAYAWSAHYNADRNYTANGLNQYSAVAGGGLTYDARGNLTASVGTTYAYNGFNQLTTVSGGFAGTLAYDPAHRLYQLNSGATVTRFQYDGERLVAEYDGANAMLRRYVHGPGSDEPIVWYEGAGTGSRRFLQADERGSVIAVSDSAGASLGINRYDEYGIPQTGNLGRFSYTGQTALPEIGLMYYKARMYSPSLGRFMQTDPIGYGDGLGWYNYVGGDPVNFVDPSGLCVLSGPVVDVDWHRPNDPGNCGLTEDQVANLLKIGNELASSAGGNWSGSFSMGINDIVVLGPRNGAGVLASLANGTSSGLTGIGGGNNGAELDCSAGSVHAGGWVCTGPQGSGLPTAFQLMITNAIEEAKQQLRDASAYLQNCLSGSASPPQVVSDAVEGAAKAAAGATAKDFIGHPASSLRKFICGIVGGGARGGVTSIVSQACGSGSR